MGGSEVSFLLLVAACSTGMVGIVRRLAVAHGVIDHPTHRGSHNTPTPRGGGLGAIAAVVIALVAIGAPEGKLVVFAGIAACVAVAAVGWFDDRRGLSVRTRLVVHILGGAAVGALSLRSSAPVAVSLVVFLWWAFWTVSSINLVNFMDGINGLAASQVAIFAGSLMLFGWEMATSSWYAGAVAAACIGFLPWNFPRARIFLGDVGSGAFGFLVPFTALLVMQDRGINVVQAHLPLLPLFGDATVTIFRRWRCGEQLNQPHRSHLYQRLANGGVGHTRVTLLYAMASLGGGIVAHSGGWGFVAAYVIALVVLGALLERRQTQPVNR